MRTVLIHVMPGADGGYEARLDPDWNGVATPGTDAPRVLFDAAPEPPADFEQWFPFLLQSGDVSAQAERLGTDLHDLIITGAIDRELRRARARGPFRLLLKVEPSKLDALPWELMRHDGMPLFTSTSIPVARISPSYNQAFESAQMCWPLRVLVVAGSADTAIQVDAEIDYIREGFRKVCGLVDLEVACLPDRDDIRKMTEAIRPHIFHFIGHGELDDASVGYLRLEQKDNAAATQWTADAIRDDLADAVPHLVVLNACQSGEQNAQTATQAAQGLAATQAAARGLAELNVPAVIAMQGPVRGEAAAQFAKGFYAALSAGRRLDEAVARARQQVTVVAQGQCDYALPSLILGAPPERIIDLSTKDPTQILTARQRAAVLSFVDRTPRRRHLWNRLSINSQACPRIFAITGPGNVGKGALVRWSLGVASVLGYPTALADLGSSEDYDSVSFLQALVTALPRVTDESAADLRSLRAELEKYRNAAASYEKDPTYLYEKLAGVLAGLSAEKALVIGIDGFGVNPDMWTAHAVPRFVGPIAQGEIGNVRLVVGLQPDHFNKCFPPRYFNRDEIEDISIDLFPSKDFVQLVSQRMRALGYARHSFEALVQVWDAQIQQLGTWGADIFGHFDDSARLGHWEQEP